VEFTRELTALKYRKEQKLIIASENSPLQKMKLTADKTNKDYINPMLNLTFLLLLV
jgi:hypothetical protein